MDRPLIQQAFGEPGQARSASVAGPGAAPQMSSLPPTRAARPARSRGVFFSGQPLARLARWAACAALVAVAALSIAATVPHVIDAPAVRLNPGPALFAATSKLPPMFAPQH